MTHGNLISSVGAVYTLLYEIFDSQDCYLGPCLFRPLVEKTVKLAKLMCLFFYSVFVCCRYLARNTVKRKN